MLRTTVFAVLMGVLIAAVPASAMEITAFDRLLQADQSRYVELLINGSKSILREQRNNEMLVKMNTVFDAPPDGISKGIYQFNDDLDTARRLQRKTGKPFHVEHALLLTFGKFKIEVPRADFMKLGERFKPSSGQ